MPRTEPNSLPPAYSVWRDWRETYNEYVREFNASKKGSSDTLQLKLRLQRHGYTGVRLDDEIEYIRNGGQ